jgi:hypothetical protein
MTTLVWSKGDAFPWDDADRAEGQEFPQYQGTRRVTKNGSQTTGKKTLQQETEVEGAAYAERVRIIDRSCL